MTNNFLNLETGTEYNNTGVLNMMRQVQDYDSCSPLNIQDPPFI